MEAVKSKAFQVRSDSPSLRATIPLAVVQTLKIRSGDTLLWELKARNGKLIAIMTRDEDHER